MSLNKELVLLCFLAGVLGAVAGAVLANLTFRKRLHTELPEQLCGRILSLLQARLGELPAPLAREPLAVQAAVAAADFRQRSSPLDAELDARFTKQQQAQADHPLQQALQRLPQMLQQAIQVELAFLATQQAQRDQALADQQAAWREEQNKLHAQRDAHYAAEINRLAQALSASRGQPEVRALSLPRAATHLHTPAPHAPVYGPQPVSARPPELLHTPIVRPASVYATEEPAPELTDTELDALPPDLPTPGRPQRRILPPPKKKPTMRNL